MIRSGWDYYAFPLQEIIGEVRAPSVNISVEVSEPFRAPGDARDLGVMVDQIMLEDDGRNLPFILVDGLVASVKTYAVEQIELTICDYAQSTAPDIIVGELRSDEYRLGAIDFQPGDVVIDIGGHIGIFSCYLAKKYPFLKIFAFEPIPVSYRMFRRNLELNEIQNIRLYNLAVTSDGRELDMVVHLQGNTGGATANLRDLELDGHARFRCASLTLDSIFRSFLIDSCKLLKIDCEGSEHEILLSARCLDRVQYLRGEFHINQHLRGQGYSIERLAHHCHRLIDARTCRLFALQHVRVISTQGAGMGIKTGIYYFTWYNEQRWKEAPVKDTPLLGQYDSTDPSIISWQLDLIRYCGIDYVIFQLIPEDDWGFATVERGIAAAIAYLRRNGMQWSFLLDAKRGPSNGVVEQPSDMPEIEKMYLYVLERRWTDGLVRGPSGKPLLLCSRRCARMLSASKMSSGRKSNFGCRSFTRIGAGTKSRT